MYTLHLQLQSVQQELRARLCWMAPRCMTHPLWWAQWTQAFWCREQKRWTPGWETEVEHCWEGQCQLQRQNPLFARPRRTNQYCLLQNTEVCTTIRLKKLYSLLPCDNIIVGTNWLFGTLILFSNQTQIMTSLICWFVSRIKKSNSSLLVKVQDICTLLQPIGRSFDAVRLMVNL